MYKRQLDFRLVQIEQRLTELESPSAKFIPLEGSFEKPVSGAEKIQDLQRRIQELESLERERQVAHRRRAEEADRFQAQRRVQMAQVAAAAAEPMLDPTASEQAKLTAWRSIRRNAADFWTDEIVAEAVRIGTTSADPQIRADIWRQAHANHTNTQLVQPLLQALGNDPHRSVREEAAETCLLYTSPSPRDA